MRVVPYAPDNFLVHLREKVQFTDTDSACFCNFFDFESMHVCLPFPRVLSPSIYPSCFTLHSLISHPFRKTNSLYQGCVVILSVRRVITPAFTCLSASRGRALEARQGSANRPNNEASF